MYRMRGVSHEGKSHALATYAENLVKFGYSFLRFARRPIHVHTQTDSCTFLSGEKRDSVILSCQ